MKEHSHGLHGQIKAAQEQSNYLFASLTQRLELNEINWRSLALMPIVTLPVCVFNVLVRLQYRKAPGIVSGLLLIAYSLLLLFFTKKGKKRFVRYATTLVYLAEVPVMLITVVTATFFTPNVAAVTALLFMAILPPFILDKALRVISFETLWALVLISMSYVAKDASLFKMDVLHVILAYLLSVGMILLILDSRFRMIRSRNDLIRFSESDALTGALNKRYFLKDMKALRNVYDESRDEKDQIVIVSCNICDMRLYNEEYGFQEGNRLLIRAADWLCENFMNRPVSRFESDHFFLMCYESELKRFVENLEQHELTGVGERPVQTTFGYYVIQSDDTEDYACDRAFFALQKVEEGQRIRCYDAKMNEEYLYHKKLLALFPAALKEEEFEVYYQPIVRSFTREISSAEALVRWNNKERGMIPLGDFMPLLEEHNLIPELDLYMVRHVLRDMKKLREETGHLIPVSVNLSRLDFVVKDMPAEIRQMADEVGMEHDKLIIEITESAFALQNTRLADVLQQFHSYGFPVWMDDFGSGYSSLNLLKNFDFDLIKFDMRFVRDLATHVNSRILLGKLVEMVDELGMQTLAEGVETEEQRTILESMGVQRMQGYLFSKPERFDYLIEQQRKRTMLTYEDFHRSQYLDVVSKANLRNPLQYDFCRNGEDMENEMPAGVLEISGDGKARYIRSNAILRDFLSEFYHFADAEKTAGDDFGASGFYLRIPEPMLQQLAVIKERGTWERLDIRDDRCLLENERLKDKNGSFFIHFLAEDEITSRSAYMVVEISE
uniref:GGDEF domain-containing phosphodiesterase n=1 Tax=Eubacterium cellulosolvens TaxID=29322 RepID=UPI000485B4C0|nr:GGDEF domain-containing phosphodiesterase [[Eubacterium] cellulosolvens]